MKYGRMYNPFPPGNFDLPYKVWSLGSTIQLGRVLLSDYYGPFFGIHYGHDRTLSLLHLIDIYVYSYMCVCWCVYVDVDIHYKMALLYTDISIVGSQFFYQFLGGSS